MLDLFFKIYNINIFHSKGKHFFNSVFFFQFKITFVLKWVHCQMLLPHNTVIFSMMHCYNWQFLGWLAQEQVIREQDEHLLKFTLLQRLETMETRVQVCPDSQKSPSNYESDVMMHKAHNFEVVSYDPGMNS